MPDSRTARRSASTTSGCWNCRCDRLTLTGIAASAGARSCHVRSCAHARAEHPLSERHDGAALLRDGHELRGPEQPARGVVPAHERLDRDHPAGAERHDRLVVEREALPVLDGPPEVGLELHPLDDAPVHLRVEHDGAGLSLELRLVHRDVRVAQHLVRLAVPRRLHRDPDARRHEQLVAGQLDAPCEGAVDAGRDQRRAGDVVAAGEEEPELVSAEPRDRVSGPDRLGEPPGDRDEEVVAGLVTEAVVDHLEPVEVEEQHGEALAVVARRRVEHVGEPVEEQRAVRQPGEGVVERVVGEPRLGAPALLDLGLQGGVALPQARAHRVEVPGELAELGAVLRADDEPEVAPGEGARRAHELVDGAGDGAGEHHRDEEREQERDGDAARQDPLRPVEPAHLLDGALLDPERRLERHPLGRLHQLGGGGGGGHPELARPIRPGRGGDVLREGVLEGPDERVHVAEPRRHVGRVVAPGAPLGGAAQLEDVLGDDVERLAGLAVERVDVRLRRLHRHHEVTPHLLDPVEEGQGAERVRRVPDVGHREGRARRGAAEDEQEGDGDAPPHVGPQRRPAGGSSRRTPARAASSRTGR